MAIKDLSKGLKKTLSDAQGVVKTATDSVKDVAKDIKVPEFKVDQISRKKENKAEEQQQEEVKPLDIKIISTRAFHLCGCRT